MNIISVKQFDTQNGPHVRTSIWVAGCSNNCKGCWSKHTWNPNQGRTLDKEYLEEIYNICSNKQVKGISILGGDPFYYYMNFNVRSIFNLIDKLNILNKPIWVWTGYTIEELLKNINKEDLLSFKKIDTLIDGRFDITKRDLTLKWKGSSNQRIINIKNYFNQ